ncbi:2,5-diketo-D-gluconate reductase A [Rhizobium rosettiformans]|uniref:Aldo/keto reductase n=2 Tax=Rhizobium rosettiformans TaxID=1368430 RepID=A0A4S8PZZ0_9HYPH|nr:aldo/keto reductase [Rhizobium rosettiformans]MBB5275533.1 2,5-diketo-D-gluconate reductase A [Rhizobium rosettiformans]THV37288.1 aldo/keto reductase [Rhizobium rosettiformans W3]
MTDQLFITLNDGARIPQVGLGVWQTPNDEAAPAVKAALDAGYRHVDTAAVYENEEGVGEGIRQSGLSRSDIFLTTKLWNNDQGYEQTLKAFEASLKRLGTDYVDLYLIHWPSAHRGLFVDTWKALVKLKEEGRAKSIGVSNFYPEHIEKIVAETGVTPVINQIELHPDFQQRGTRAFHEKHKIATQSWSPLGQGKLLGHPVIAEIAQTLGRTPAQVIIRWHIDNGLVVIPKSVTPSRIVENFKVFDFQLSPEDLQKLKGLDDAGARIGPDPKTASF